MDAVGRFDFVAQDFDELSFRKGTALKVIKYLIMAFIVKYMLNAN